MAKEKHRNLEDVENPPPSRENKIPESDVEAVHEAVEDDKNANQGRTQEAFQAQRREGNRRVEAQLPHDQRRRID